MFFIFLYKKSIALSIFSSIILLALKKIIYCGKSFNINYLHIFHYILY